MSQKVTITGLESPNYEEKSKNELKVQMIIKNSKLRV